MLDNDHQCSKESCWCKRQKPVSLGDLIFEIGKLKERINETTASVLLVAELFKEQQKEKRGSNGRKKRS